MDVTTLAASFELMESDPLLLVVLVLLLILILFCTFIGGNGNKVLLQNGLVQHGSSAGDRLWYEGLSPTHDSRQVVVSTPAVKTGDSVNIMTKYDVNNATVTFQFYDTTTGVANNLQPMSTMTVYNRSTGAQGTTTVNNLYNGESAEAIDERDFDYSTGQL